MTCRKGLTSSVGYPFDLDADMAFTRDSGARDSYPAIPMVGWINGLVPLFDQQVYAGARAENASGPWIGSQPALPEIHFGNVIFPQLQKVKG